MPVVVCSACGTNLRVPDAAIGRTAKCGKCKEVIRVGRPKVEPPTARKPIGLPVAPKSDPFEAMGGQASLWATRSRRKSHLFVAVAGTTFLIALAVCIVIYAISARSEGQVSRRAQEVVAAKADADPRGANNKAAPTKQLADKAERQRAAQKTYESRIAAVNASAAQQSAEFSRLIPRAQVGCLYAGLISEAEVDGILDLAQHGDKIWDSLAYNQKEELLHYPTTKTYFMKKFGADPPPLSHYEAIFMADAKDPKLAEKLTRQMAAAVAADAAGLAAYASTHPENLSRANRMMLLDDPIAAHCFAHLYSRIGSGRASQGKLETEFGVGRTLAELQKQLAVLEYEVKAEHEAALADFHAAVAE